jgi:NADPH-dependent 7-cyano-7-deazaguanine reductase QueF
VAELEAVLQTTQEELERTQTALGLKTEEYIALVRPVQGRPCLTHVACKARPCCSPQSAKSDSDMVHMKQEVDGLMVEARQLTDKLTDTQYRWV